MVALVFPGQGSQFTGMGKDLYDNLPAARSIFEEANEVLGYNIASIMFEGSAEELKATKVTQPAIYLHSIVTLKLAVNIPDYQAVAGHSLGEFSALVASNSLSWLDGLKLVQLRANAMQEACELSEGTMAAVIGLDDEKVIAVCKEIDEVVIPANFNSPGQIVISGSVLGIEKATEKLKENAAKRVIPLVVGGAFHSPLMLPAKLKLEAAIATTQIKNGDCPIYQNVDALANTDSVIIKEKLVSQLDSPVKWTQTVENMVRDGFTSFVEVGGKGKVLTGLIKRFKRELHTDSL